MNKDGRDLKGEKMKNWKDDLWWFKSVCQVMHAIVCSTIRQMLVRVKNGIPEDRRKWVIYEIPCKDCEKLYIGETGRTLKKRVSEHKRAVMKFNMNNGVAAHVHNEDHWIDWEGAKVIGQQEFYWKKSSRAATQCGNAWFQCFGCTCLPTHKLDQLHPGWSFSNTTAVYFK